MQGNLTQQLGAYGSVYLNLTQQDYCGMMIGKT
ncbi:hypothetical protein ACLB1R_25290 [Escherichia coli]